MTVRRFRFSSLKDSLVFEHDKSGNVLLGANEFTFYNCFNVFLFLSFLSAFLCLMGSIVTEADFNLI